MSIKEQISEWVLGIYTDKAVGAKVLKSVIGVLPENAVLFNIYPSSRVCARVITFDEHFCDKRRWNIELEDDVSVVYTIDGETDSVPVLLYPIDLVL